MWWGSASPGVVHDVFGCRMPRPGGLWDLHFPFWNRTILDGGPTWRAEKEREERGAERMKFSARKGSVGRVDRSGQRIMCVVAIDGLLTRTAKMTRQTVLGHFSNNMKPTR